MPISSDRLIKKFFIGGHSDGMPPADSGYNTFEEAIDRVVFLQENAELPRDLYIYEAFVVELPAS